MSSFDTIQPEFEPGTGTSPFFGQKGQDEWVLTEVFDCRRRGFRRGGYFVDLACSDGVTINNTLFMERYLGWSGILIEPNPAFHETLRATRHAAISTRVIAAERGVAKFRLDNRELGGIVGEGFDNSQRVRGAELASAEIVEVSTVPLVEVLEEHDAPREIDYLSLDVEGAEWEVLRGFPFDRYQFACMTIERPPLELDLLLDGHGYLQVRTQQYDAFYIHRDHLDRSAVRVAPRFRRTPPKDW